MRLGVRLVHPPAASTPATLRTLAQAAETLGYRSLWVDDPMPTGPVAAHGRPTADLDALCSLAYAAALTSRIRLGTCVRVGDGLPARRLARVLHAVDGLSAGRLLVGLSDPAEPGEVDPIDEVLDALDASWSPEARGGGPTDAPPATRPRPPRLLTGSGAAALDRVGRRGDGLLVTDLAPDLERVAADWAAVTGTAQAHGRDGDDLLLAVLVGVGVDEPPAAVADRVHAVRTLGATDVILAADERASLDDALACYAATAEAVEREAIG